MSIIINGKTQINNVISITPCYQGFTVTYTEDDVYGEITKDFYRGVSIEILKGE